MDKTTTEYRIVNLASQVSVSFFQETGSAVAYVNCNKRAFRGEGRNKDEAFARVKSNLQDYLDYLLELK